MSFANARLLVSQLSDEVSQLVEWKRLLESQVVTKSETLARLEALKAKPRRPPTNNLLLLNSGVKLKPTKTVVSAPAFPDIEPSSSECSEILPHLYLGGNIVARDLGILQSKNITRILNAAKGVCPDYFPDNFKYTSFELLDAPHEEIGHFILHAIAEIEDALERNERILVHCHMGASRSATLVIAYVVWKQNVSVQDALHFVKQRRGVVSPNAGFLAQLAKFEARFHQREQVYSLFHLTLHSEHVNTLVVKQVFTGNQILRERPQDVFVGFCPAENTLFVRVPPVSKEEWVTAALEIASWMSKYDPPYRNSQVQMVHAEDDAFWNVVNAVDSMHQPQQCFSEVVQHILSSPEDAAVL